MESQQPHIVIKDTLEGVGEGNLANYLAHSFCYEGSCSFTYNHKVYTLKSGDCMIIRRCDLVSNLRPAEDFRVDVIYVTPEFIEISTPPCNYGMRGAFSLFNNPVMHLTSEQQKVCALDFDYIKKRWALGSKHHFHREAMINAIQCMIIDFFDFHVALHSKTDRITTQYADLMERFLELLDRGDYRQNRDISYYASKLYVTSKYLSDVCKKVSGFAANYWILRYTTLDISRQLRIQKLSITELSELYCFSSPSYFTRFIQKYLGVSPSELRK